MRTFFQTARGGRTQRAASEVFPQPVRDVDGLQSDNNIANVHRKALEWEQRAAWHPPQLRFTCTGTDAAAWKHRQHISARLK